MIEQTGGLNSTIQNERLYRESSTAESTERQPSREQEAARQSARTSDTVSLSAEAVALQRNVPPTGAASEAQESPTAESRSEDAREPSRPGSIDIRV